MFEDEDYDSGDDDMPDWLILPIVLIGLGILAGLGFGYMVLFQRPI